MSDFKEEQVQVKIYFTKDPSTVLKFRLPVTVERGVPIFVDIDPLRKFIQENKVHNVPIDFVLSLPAGNDGPGKVLANSADLLNAIATHGKALRVYVDYEKKETPQTSPPVISRPVSIVDSPAVDRKPSVDKRLSFGLDERKSVDITPVPGLESKDDDKAIVGMNLNTIFKKVSNQEQLSPVEALIMAKEYSRVAKKVKSYEVDLKALKGDLKDVLKLKHKLHADMEAKKHELKASEVDREGLAARVEDLQKTLTMSQEQFQVLQRRSDDLLKEQKESQIHPDKYNEFIINAIKGSMDSVKAEFENSRLVMKVEIEHVRTKNVQLEAENARLREEISQMNAEYPARVAQEINNLSSQNEQRFSELSRMFDSSFRSFMEESKIGKRDFDNKIDEVMKAFRDYGQVILQNSISSSQHEPVPIVFLSDDEDTSRIPEEDTFERIDLFPEELRKLEKEGYSKHIVESLLQQYNGDVDRVKKEYAIQGYQIRLK